MTKPAAPKMQAGRRNVALILKQVVRAVAYLVALALATAAMASCQSNAVNCNAPGVVCDF